MKRKTKKEKNATKQNNR